MSYCLDHGDDENPWGCMCMRAKLDKMQKELEALKAEKGIEPTPEKCLSCEYHKCGICRRCIDFDQWEAKRELPKFKEPGQ